MPINIDRDIVRAMLSVGVPVIDVLPAKEYETEHVAGAISIPLTKLTRETTARLDKGRPVIVYCNDYQ